MFDMLPSSVPVSLKIFEDLKSQQCPKVCCIARPRLWEIISLNIRWCDSSPSSSADSSVMFSRLVIYVVLLCFASLSWPTFFLVENCSSWWWLQCDVVQEVAGCCSVVLGVLDAGPQQRMLSLRWKRARRRDFRTLQGLRGVLLIPRSAKSARSGSITNFHENASIRELKNVEEQCIIL